MSDAPNDILTQLSSDERVLWWDKPRQGLILRPADGFLVPFSVLWLGFAIFWLGTALSIDKPIPSAFPIVGGVFVIAGFQFAIGRFFMDAYVRRKTTYAITTQRILICYTGMFGGVRTIKKETLSNPELICRNGSDLGTIWFGTATFQEKLNTQMNMFPVFWNIAAPHFESIPNPHEVYNLLTTSE